MFLPVLRSIVAAGAILLFASVVQAEDKLHIELTIPELQVNPYHKPYVAIWLEQENRQYVTTIALWADDMEWYKDLRQWWRKAGRSQLPFDSATGATKKPGTYQIDWSGKDNQGKSVPAGTYYLKIEASREEGGREFVKTKVHIDKKNQLTLAGSKELGQINIQIVKGNKV